MSNWEIIENLVNQFKTINDFDLVIHGLVELRHQMSSTLASNKMRLLSAFINDAKLQKNYDKNELFDLLHTLQNEYR